MFGETRRYRDSLVKLLGLNQVHIESPNKDLLKRHKVDGMNVANDINLCCFVRRVEPLKRALRGYKAWISGRKRYQSTSRINLKVFEIVDEKIKINPLANWSPEDIQTYFKKHNLPKHPLEKEGYLSIGCMPCTDRVSLKENPRSGRWRGLEKEECGIHIEYDKALRLSQVND